MTKTELCYSNYTQKEGEVFVCYPAPYLNTTHVRQDQYAQCSYNRYENQSSVKFEDQAQCGYQQTRFASCPLAKGDNTYNDHLKYIR